MDLLELLPEQTIRDIVIRTPYTSHNILKEISEVCKPMVESEDLSEDRIKIGESEKFICLLHEAGITMYDPARDSWHPLPPMPAGFIPRKCSRLVFWRKKLVVIGLEHDNRAQSILVYHFGTSSWHVGEHEVPGILRDDWQFGYSASADGIVCVPPRQVYMIDKETWEVPSGLSIEGMAYLFNNWTDQPRMFDPNRGTWIRIYGHPRLGVPASTTGRYENYLLGLCRIWGWKKIFWDGGAPLLELPFYRRFRIFQADPFIRDDNRWIHIQTPVEIGNRTVLSVTTAEI
ncbi:hypothetical protein SUGI_0669630 [Cryptomeria japonica]|nr:hypothetical protein SUGI_0669630 [Cryptomeria japonica]